MQPALTLGRLRIVGTALVGACSVIAASAAGLGGYGPPFITDDPEPVDFHHWEVYIASYYFHNQGVLSGTLPHLEVNYGAAPNLQIHLIAPLAFSQPVGGSFNYGYGDTEFGVKYRFMQETRTQPMAAIFPLIEIPTGDQSRGLGNGEAQIFLPVWLQKSWAQWTTYGGGGYWHNPGAGNHDYLWFGWLLQNQVSRQLAVGAEVFHATNSPTVDGSATTGFNVGAVYDFDDGHHFLISAGRGFSSDNVFTGYVAYQWTFGPKEKKEEKQTSNVPMPGSGKFGF